MQQPLLLLDEASQPILVEQSMHALPVVHMSHTQKEGEG